MKKCNELFENILSIEIYTIINVSLDDISQDNTLQTSTILQESENIFSLISFLNDHSHSITDNSAAYSDKEIAAIDKKLNVCIKMMMMLFSSNQQVSNQTVKFSARGIQWLSDFEYSQDSKVTIEFYPLAEFPRPVRIPAIILSQEHTDHKYLTCAKFTDLTQSMNDSLEKYVFRQHRRTISQQKNK